MSDFVLEPRGPFTAASAARFIAGWPPAGRPGAAEGDPDTIRLGFLADDWSGHAGVVLRQGREHGPVTATITQTTAADDARVVAQAARIVSLDHDGEGYGALGDSDEVIGRLQRASGWLRPVLFHFPYEAACWAIISLRVRQPVAARARDKLSRAHGAVLNVDGEELVGFPPPQRLLAVTEAPQLGDEKLLRLHGIAQAALEGRLDRERLLAAGREDALAQLLELRGIGPYWAEGVFVRAVGPTDAPVLVERRLRHAAVAAYQLPEVIDDDTAFEALAERWRPFRTWVGVLLRATA